MSRKKFPEIKESTYLEYFQERLKEGFNPEDIFSFINAIAIKDYSEDVMSDTSCSTFCNYWNENYSWENKKEKFIYRYWKSLLIVVKETNTKTKTIRDEDGNCPIIKFNPKKKQINLKLKSFFR